MSTLNITAVELQQLKDMKDNGQIADAWNFLGSKGDAYAYLAGGIIKGVSIIKGVRDISFSELSQ